MTVFRPARRKNLPVQWLLASLSFHSLLALCLMQFANAHPNGRGRFGVATDESFTVTWIPGNGGGGSGFDTAIPGDGSDDAAGADSITSADSPPPSVTPEDDRQTKGKLIATVETDPQDVFGDQPVKSVTFETTSSTEITTDDPNIAGVRPARPQGRETDSNDVDDGQPTVSHRGVTDGEEDDSGLDSNETNGNRTGGATGRGGSGNGGGEGKVSFFGLVARARRIVYAIDASESMRKNRAMEIARSELSLSLKGLEPSAQFQIVFFDVKTHSMSRPGEKAGLLRATSANLRLADHFIKGIQPEAGTDRFAAVKHAMSFDPDVIFLLTDADEPEISAKELWEIRKTNKRHTVINTVEFGLGADLSKDSFLKKLARQNNGTHTYRDLIKTAGKKP